MSTRARTKPRKSVRLPDYVRPEHYRLVLRPDIEGARFEGRETIRLVLDRPVRGITLHAQQLEISEASLVQGAAVVPVVRTDYDAERETVTLHLARTAAKGNCELHLAFRGVLGSAMRGFYRSRYAVNGKEHFIATTQFEATDARKAFPCVDEPACKAVFEVGLTIPGDKSAISNTIPVETVKNGDGTKTVTFAPTPKMSTYLLAFIVGDFEHVQKKTKEGVLVRVFVTPGKKRQAEFALDCAVRALSFFSNYFDIAYPLPALDMIAIPDFASAAMENWGAVTYRESAILFDEEHSSLLNKQWVALVIAHELAHQWFGNLVTMEWWTHLWLNEGFANYIEYLAIDHMFPEWDVWTRFISMDHPHSALNSDSLRNTHPVEVEVHHPGEIDEVFDSISYGKGSGLIRMLSGYLGETLFRDSLRHYLKKHAHGNVATLHLWQAFEQVSGKPVTRMMRTWTRREGYPLIKVAEDKRGLVLEQSRFFSHPALQKKNTDRTVWSMPVNCLGPDGVQKFFLDRRRMRIENTGAWTKLNAGEVGFFRTLYPPRMYKALKEPVAKQIIPVRDRFGLIRDLFALAEAGECRLPEALEFAEAYAGETEHPVWTEIAAGLHRAYNRVIREPFADEYAGFCRGIFAEAAERLGWEKESGESYGQTALRGLVLWNYGFYGDLDTVARAKRLFAKVHLRKNPVPPDLRTAVYRLAAWYGGPQEHAKLLQLYRSAGLQEEEDKLADALGKFRQRTLLRKTLEFSLSKEVRFQDSLDIMAGVMANPFGRELGWEFTQEHWRTLVERYGEGHTLARYISSLSVFSSPPRLRELRKFFQAHPVPPIARTVRQVLERVEANTVRVPRDSRDLADWLSRRG